MFGRNAVDVRLKVDPVSCDGVGMCAHVAPDVVELDPWGYPVLPAGTAPVTRQARRAVRVCPRRALWVEEVAGG